MLLSGYYGLQFTVSRRIRVRSPKIAFCASKERLACYYLLSLSHLASIVMAPKTGPGPKSAAAGWAASLSSRQTCVPHLMSLNREHMGVSRRHGMSTTSANLIFYCTLANTMRSLSHRGEQSWMNSRISPPGSHQVWNILAGHEELAATELGQLECHRSRKRGQGEVSAGRQVA